MTSQHPGAGGRAASNGVEVAWSARGEGPVVVLVHGVGFGPETYEPVADRLAELGARAVVVHRRGYGDSAWLRPACGLAEQVEDVAGVLDRIGVRRAVWAGASGGATIVLAAALWRRARVAGAVVHEPALGRLAPGVHSALQAIAGDVAASHDPHAGALAFARRLVGVAGWRRVPGRARDALVAAGPTILHEIPHFPRFAPREADLRGLPPLPLVSSVGAASPRERHAAARVLVDLARAWPAVIPCGHLAQIEAPAALAALAADLAHRIPPDHEEQG